MNRTETCPELVFWQNTISLHQAPLLRELSTSLNLSVLLITIEGVGKARAGLGWDSADYGATEIVTTDFADRWKSLSNSTRGAKAHVFSGLGSYPLIDAMRERISQGDDPGHIAVFSEPWDPRGFKGLARSYRGAARVKRSIGGIDTVLAAGSLAYRQFERFGVPQSKLMKFGYSVAAAPMLTAGYRQDSSTFRLIFVGSLTARKDPLLLLQALSQMKDLPWHLTILGRGPLEQAIKLQALQKGLSERVTLTGQLNQETTRMKIAESDALILPSRFDGWGSVVNEALMSGVRAVVSDAAGASEIIVSKTQGAVFRHRSSRSLERALRTLIESEHFTNDQERLRDWAEATISPSAFARQLMRRIESPQIIPHPAWNHTQPEGPPWT